MKRRLSLSCLGICLATLSVNSFALLTPLTLYKRPGFFRFSFDYLSMPNDIESMGLVGINYFADFTPNIYGGVGAYGAVIGTQGGLFTLGIEGGYHQKFTEHWWGDVGMFVGGGGGSSSLVGGGLMIRPHVGILYDLNWMRLGLHYSYISFPNGQIHSQQIGADVEFPFDFYYLAFRDTNDCLYRYSDVTLCDGNCLAFQRNDFGLLLQAYLQKPGTLGVNGQVQDGTMYLVGAELDHYYTNNSFWWIKAAGAFSGIPNGYMDILGGLGYQWHFAPGIALVPQFGVGAGGGGNANTGGGILINPQLGLQIPITDQVSARIAGGYLWSPKGTLSAYTGTATLFYHLDLATASHEVYDAVAGYLRTQAWRIQILNKTYISPQRTYSNVRSSDNLIAVQLDQYINPWIFFSYQAASAYSGVRAGGLATGLIGPGIQTSPFLNDRFQLFAEVLIGASGGGGLRAGGGAVIEPVAGFHYAFTDAIGLNLSYSQMMALRNELNTPVINFGFTIKFGTLNHDVGCLKPCLL